MNPRGEQAPAARSPAAHNRLGNAAKATILWKTVRPPLPRLRTSQKPASEDRAVRTMRWIIRRHRARKSTMAPGMLVLERKKRETTGLLSKRVGVFLSLF